MQNKPGGSSWRRITATTFAALAVIAGCAMGYFKISATAVASGNEKAIVRLDEEQKLASRYRKISSETMVFSADTQEARSSVFLESALRDSGAVNPEVKSSEPQSVGGLKKIETNVNFDGAPLSTVVRFMRKVDSERPQLSLVGAHLERPDDTSPDSWNVRLTYIALIRAK